MASGPLCKCGHYLTAHHEHGCTLCTACRMFDRAPKTRPTVVQRALKLEDVPQQKWTHIAARTFLGTLIFALGIFGGVKLQWNQWVVLSVCAVGAHMFSGQILTASVKAILGLLGEVAAVVSGAKRSSGE